MTSYIWPADDKQIRRTVMASFGILVAAKALNTGVPFIFRYQSKEILVSQLFTICTYQPNYKYCHKLSASGTCNYLCIDGSNGDSDKN